MTPVEKDKSYLEASISELETYLLSQELYWPISARGFDLPRLTIGGILLTQARLEACGERIEALELSVFDDPNREALDEIHHLKRELVLLRRLLWPQRDALASLTRGDHQLVTQETRLYLRDCYDHAVHALDLVESYREMASSLLEVYLSSLSNRMNDVMKVLTIIATVFIPLSFIASVYGMNFDRSASPWNMPELGLRYGYPLLWLVMLLIVGGMLFYFHRKRWI